MPTLPYKYPGEQTPPIRFRSFSLIREYFLKARWVYVELVCYQWIL